MACFDQENGDALGQPQFQEILLRTFFQYQNTIPRIPIRFFRQIQHFYTRSKNQMIHQNRNSVDSVTVFAHAHCYKLENHPKVRGIKPKRLKLLFKINFQQLKSYFF